jgi:hypothetical protein
MTRVQVGIIFFQKTWKVVLFVTETTKKVAYPKRKTLLISEKRCVVFNFGHKNSGQRFEYETPSAVTLYLVFMSTGILPFLGCILVFYQVPTKNLQICDFSDFTI